MQAIINPLRRFTSSVRLRPFDTSTAEGRAQERIRRGALTSITAALARLISLATPLITLPISLHYLGQEVYGLWMATSAFVGMFLFSDLGLGNGLMSTLSRAIGKGDVKIQQELVSSAFFLLTGIAVLMAGIFFALFPFLPWAEILNAKTPATSQAAATVVVALALPFIINIPLNIVQRTQLAMQEGYQSNLWQCVGSVLGMVTLVVGVKLGLAPAWLLFSVSMVPVLVAGANWWVFFYWKHPSVKPVYRRFSLQQGRNLMRMGVAFFIISLLMTLGMSADNIIIAHICGLKAVTVYSVPARIAMLLTAVINMICLPMWTANSEALARGDIDWVRHNTMRLFKITLALTTFVSVVIVTLLPPFVHLWLGKDFDVSIWLLMEICASALAFGAAVPFFMALNGAGFIVPQVKLYLLFTPLVILLKIIITMKMGTQGVPIAQTICYAGIVLPWSYLNFRKCLDNIKKNHEPPIVG